MTPVDSASEAFANYVTMISRYLEHLRHDELK